MYRVGFEPTRTNTTVLETVPLDRSGIDTKLSDSNRDRTCDLAINSRTL